MKLYAVRIFVFNWIAACEFYEKTLGLPVEFKDYNLGWAEFYVGDTKIALERIDNSADEEEKALVGRFLGISLMVDDMLETYKQLLSKGVEFTLSPEKQVWGGLLAQFKDVDGNVLTLMSEESKA